MRTMMLDAEEQLTELIDLNERQGPLFKMTDDPRVTRVGRIIRELNIDELPQLWNVLRGDMSLVGPRPALPAEFALFDSRLRARANVLPGITGLWQVEARDNPSFEAYARLDLFYVENWSPMLDLTILVSTIESELGRVARRLVRRDAGERYERTRARSRQFRRRSPSGAACVASAPERVGERGEVQARLPFRRKPTAVERVIGRRRARVLRRRIGILAIGLGFSLVKRTPCAAAAVSRAGGRRWPR